VEFELLASVSIDDVDKKKTALKMNKAIKYVKYGQTFDYAL